MKCKRSRRNFPIWQVFILAVVVLPAMGAEKVQITTAVQNPMLDFAVGELKQALKHAGYEVGDQGASIRLDLENGKPESFHIRREASGVLVQGADLRGLMYGALALAEKVALGSRLNNLTEESQAPFLPVRSLKFNMPLEGTLYLSEEDLQNNRWFWDLSYWRDFFDTMARNRYNAISFWTAHPFDQMVRLPKYPEATTLSAQQMDHNIGFFRELFRMAKERGIDTYLVTWNIHVSPAFGRAHHIPDAGADSDLVRDYMRECLKTLLETYPDLTGLGTTQGERMDSIPEDQRAQWIADVYLPAIKAAGRDHLPFIIRYWGGLPGPTEKAFASYDGPLYLDIKYNGEHMYSSTQFHVEDMQWLNQPHHYKLLWHLRNDDLVDFHWGNPGWVSELMRNLARTDTAGYTMGSEIDVPGFDRIHTAATRSHVTWKYKFEKMWFQYALWGRMGYDPALPEEVWKGHFRQHYGRAGDATYKATLAASRIAPAITSYHWNYMNGDWYPEGSIGSWNTSAEQPRVNYRRVAMYHDIRTYIFNNTIDASLEDPIQYAARILNHGAAPKGVETLLDVAKDLEQLAGVALSIDRISDSGASLPKEFQCAKLDNEAYGHLGLYYAAKLRATAALSLFLFSSQAQYKTDAIAQLQKALAEWQRLVAVTELHYVPHEVWLFGRFHWNMYTPSVQQDIEIARQMEPFASQPQQWQVAPAGAEGSPARDMTIQIIPPFNLAGLDAWLVYFNSLSNRPAIEKLLGPSPKISWRRRFSLPPGEAVAIGLAGKPTGEVRAAEEPLKSATGVSGSGYDVFLDHQSGRVEIVAEAGAVPQAIPVTTNKADSIDLQAASAAEIVAPLAKSPAGTLALAQARTAARTHTFTGVASDLYNAGSAVYRFQIAIPGYYKVSCFVRSPTDRMSFHASLDDWHGRETSISGNTPGNTWQWLESPESYALGAGAHNLRLVFVHARDEIKEIRIEPIP